MTLVPASEPRLTSGATIDVVGVGAVCIDTVCRVPRAPGVSGAASKVRVNDRVSRPGGQTATALCACARLGLRSAFVGTVGRDAGEAMVRATFVAHGVDVTHLVTRDADTATAVIVVPDGTGERMVLWHRDPALSLDLSTLPTVLLQGATVVHVDDVDLPVAIAAARVARQAGVAVTTDIDQETADVLELVAEATHAIYAEHVPSALTHDAGPEVALTALGERFPSTVHCVTLGADGALLWHDGTLHRVRGHSVAVVDTTGAGDTFRAGFIFGLCQRWPLPRVLEFANAAAAISCTRSGGIAAAPTLAEVMKLTRGHE